MSKVVTDIVEKALKILDTKTGESITTIQELATLFPEVDYAWFCANCLDERLYSKIDRNRAAIRKRMKKRWFVSHNAKLQQLGFQLIATEEELERIDGTFSARGTKRKDPLLEVLDPKEVWNAD